MIFALARRECCKFLFFFLTLCSGTLVYAQTNAQIQPLKLVETIPLGGVEGRIDHFSPDIAGHRLFLSALGNNTVEVIDLAVGRRVRTIAGLHEPQGVLYAPQSHKLFVANTGGGILNIYDGDSFTPLTSVSFGDDADNVRYDAKNRLVYVGYAEGGLGVLDAATGRRLSDAVAFDGHPESFQLESKGSRIFANLPGGRIAVVDRGRRKVTSYWRAGGAASENYPMALDETDHRLFVGFRQPAQIVVFDTESGKVAAKFAAPGDMDDVFYDASRRRIYASGGSGLLDVFEVQNPDRYKLSSEIRTAGGARTSLFVPELGRLYLAVPHRGSQPAEIRVYEAQ